MSRGRGEGRASSEDDQGTRRFALFYLGFRPFYLLASLFAAASVLLWIAQYAGWLSANAYLAGPVWHGHEMVFGFAEAVIAGFLFTAVRNWTGHPTPTGATLAAIAAVWLAARIAVLTPYGWLAMALSAAFPLLVAAGIARPLAASGNTRNYFFVALLVALALADVAFNLAYRDVLDFSTVRGLHIALDVVLFVIAVIGGRVIPMFTNNATPGAGAGRHPLIERAALATVLLVLAADLLHAPAWATSIAAALAALANGARLSLWHPWRTLRTPLVWILHFGYGWIVVHFALRAFAGIGIVPEPLATHALTMGAIGAMTIGMMTRTARGHTGRPLGADRWEITMFVAINIAAFARVFGPLAAPSHYLPCVVAAGLLWSATYALYAIRYWPILTRPRADGKPG
jgi:uncharacterized protein involved in response to NO